MLRRRARAGQGRPRADRPLRQLGGRDDRRHRQLSRGARPLPFRAPADQAALARRARHPALQQGRLRRDRQARLARPHRSSGSSAATSIVFPFDQHAAPPDGIEVEFFGHPAWTFKSLAIIALATGAPVRARRELARAGRPARAALRGAARRRSNTPTRARRSAATRAPTTRRSSAWSCATPSSGTGCTGAGNPLHARARRRAAGCAAASDA